MFSKYESIRNRDLAAAVDGVTIPIEGKGEIELNFGKNSLRIGDVLYSPKFRRNLLSGPRFDTRGATFEGKDGKIKVYKEGKFLFSVRAVF